MEGEGLSEGKSSLLYVPGSPQPSGYHPTTFLLPVPPSQDMLWVRPGGPKPCTDPTCPLDPSPHSMSPMLNPGAPVGISAQCGAPRAVCA